MPDFIVMTPIYQGIDGHTCWSIEKAHQAGLKFLWVPGTEGKGDALICRSRSIAATSFMEHGKCDYLIFLDSDIVFEPIQLKKLYEDMKSGYDIIGGMYPTRSGTDNASYFWGGIAPKTMGIQEIQFLSTGFMGITKYALQKIVKEYRYPDGTALPLLHAGTEGHRSYPFFEARWKYNSIPDADGTTHMWLSEDWDFCEKARQVGFKIYADLDIQLGHQGNRIVTFDDVKEYRERLALAEKGKKDRENCNKRDNGEYTDFVEQSRAGAIS